MGAYRAAFFGVPIARPNHQLASGFNRHLQVMQLNQFLTGQRRAEVTVVRTDQVDGRRADGVIKPSV